MNMNLDAIKKTLRSEKDAFVATVKTLKAQLTDTEEGLLRVVGALNALEQKPTRTAARHNTATTRTSKPCCTKSEVIAIVARLLKDNGQLSATEIEELAKDKLANEQNKSLSGFAMRLKETLRDPQFVETRTGNYELASNGLQQ